jgi:Tfp pilus assembly protein PilN
MIAVFSNNDLEIAIVESGALRFLQSFNVDKIIESGEMKTEVDIVIDKLWRAMNFHDSEKGQKGSIKKVYLAGDYEKIRDYKEIIGKKIDGLSADFASILSIFPEMPLVKDSNLPQITFGASLRGLMPREEDAIISLMPIGTEEAYERKRMLSFAKIASDLVSVLSIFFIILFLGSWILMTVLLGNIEKSLQRQSSLPEGLIELKGQAVIFNETINQVDQLRQQTPKWSRFLERLGSFLAYGVTINRVDASIGGVTINGAALTRDSLLQFKTILEKTGLFSEVKIPFNYLEQKENISFSLILKFKDTEFIFK